MTRRTRFRLDKVIDRIHVLEGRMVVYLSVDEVIQTIRESDEPRAALMERFKLTERQADDILEMRLRQLARLEGIKIEQELAGKRESRFACRSCWTTRPRSSACWSRKSRPTPSNMATIAAR